MEAEERIVLEPERKRITGVARSRWYTLEAEDDAVPHRRQLVGRRTGWLLSELLEWVKARPIARNAPPREAMKARGFGGEQAARG